MPPHQRISRCSPPPSFLGGREQRARATTLARLLWLLLPWSFLRARCPRKCSPLLPLTFLGVSGGRLLRAWARPRVVLPPPAASSPCARALRRRGVVAPPAVAARPRRSAGCGGDLRKLRGHQHGRACLPLQELSDSDRACYPRVFGAGKSHLLCRLLSPPERLRFRPYSARPYLSFLKRATGLQG